MARTINSTDYGWLWIYGREEAIAHCDTAAFPQITTDQEADGQSELKTGSRVMRTTDVKASASLVLTSLR